MLYDVLILVAYINYSMMVPNSRLLSSETLGGVKGITLGFKVSTYKIIFSIYSSVGC